MMQVTAAGGPGVAAPAASGATRRWQRLSYAYGALAAVVLGYFLAGLTIQVSDSFGNLLAVQDTTLGALVRDQLGQQAYLRPLLWAQIKIVHDLAGGEYFLWFRGIHVAQAAILIVLCVRLMRPRTALDAALVPLGLAAVIGAHTFAPLVREGNPINAYLTIAICGAAAANLALGVRARWYTDAAAVGLFAAAMLTVENGILVWVVCVAAAAAGARGVSRPGLALMTLALAAYVVVRIAALDTGAPALTERASGFGFSVLEPAQLVERFGDRPLPFYAYNVLSSIATVLFAEPKGGTWRFVYEASVGRVHPWTLVSVLSSTASTIVLAWFVWSRRARIRSRDLGYDEQVVMVFLATLVVNAALSFPYTKNAIMSTAGVLLGPALVAASRAWWSEVAAARAVATVVLFTVLTCGWAYRVAGTHYNLRQTAAMQRAEWVRVDDWLARQRIVLDDDRARALRDDLRRDALWNHPTPPQPSTAWSRWIDIDW